MGSLDGKTALVFGVANRRSIAWAIGSALAAAGASVAFTFQNERVEQGVRELAESVNSPLVMECDLAKDEHIEALKDAVSETFGGKLHIMVHAVAFAAREDLEGRFLDTKRENFAMAMDISAYSLVAAMQRFEGMLEAAGGGSVITMTYLGGERAVPNYNMMGVAKSALDSIVRYLAMELGKKKIRVNAISAGPIRTLAARSIAGFGVMHDHYEKWAPLGNVEAGDVGQMAIFLASDASSMLTGEVIHLDGGFHAIVTF